jgi:hypothetical protein
MAFWRRFTLHRAILGLKPRMANPMQCQEELKPRRQTPAVHWTPSSQASRRTSQACNAAKALGGRRRCNPSNTGGNAATMFHSAKVTSV